ncbi:hypothetical protein EJ576_23615 [Pseudomonas sp. C 49-2]|uniref:Uncharacterized protein n=1 Tax=Pseudomonas canadensis TaxID=915099 RepID=A0A423FH24_9PSED|nr:MULTISPECIES: hypothetical protein [Pseudomonas]MEB2649103.1 hypothetical protein [Pseudomonas canadensis]ROM57033.1 hypothetical protein BK649_02285 [Pseudomonas canadensis]RTX95469.1 hypothetical protein EJ576_23615 [Pseudomonas sp. C 49-2]
MNPLTRFLTATAFALAGTAVHANAAVEKSSCAASTCFQLTPVQHAAGHNLLVEDGSRRTPLGQALDHQTA